jgi:hypothetical protein
MHGSGASHEPLDGCETIIQELLVLRYLEEPTYDEIASILHVSRRTVNAISRVPKPSFATPMKDVTRTLYPRDKPPWTPQHTWTMMQPEWPSKAYPRRWCRWGTWLPTSNRVRSSSSQ